MHDPSRVQRDAPAVALLREKLVDRMHVWTHPVTIGTGKRLFAEGTRSATWKLAKSRVGDAGAIIATYEPAGELVTGTIGARLGEQSEHWTTPQASSDPAHAFRVLNTCLYQGFRADQADREAFTASGGGSRPILDGEPADALEFRSVVCDEPQVERAGVCCNQQVVGADEGAPLLQVSSDLGVMECGVIGEVQRLDVREKGSERRGVLGATRRDLHAG